MLSDFLNKYFIHPIYVEEGYNLINTAVYAVLALLLLYIIYKFLIRINFKIDLKFFASMVPFIFLGASIRAFVDNDYISTHFWRVSPGIWVLIATLFLVVCLIAYLVELQTKYPYWKLCSIAGIIFVMLAWLIVSSKLKFEHGVGAITILSIFSAAVVILYSFGKTFDWKWITHKAHFLAISTHLFDATNTFIIVDFFGGLEKHPIPRFFIEKFGTGLVFYPLKLLVLLPAVYLIFTELKGDKQLRNFLLIAIAVLGFSEGLRNFISLVLA